MGWMDHGDAQFNGLMEDGDGRMTGGVHIGMDGACRWKVQWMCGSMEGRWGGMG